MAHYTCTLNWDGNVVDPVYSPSQGQNGMFSVGDTITFLSPDTTTEVVFPKGSPFESHRNRVMYPLPTGAAVSKTILRSCFVCKVQASGAADGTGTFPTNHTTGKNVTHECRITLDAGALQLIYPTGKQLLFIGDSIRFVNTTAKPVSIRFELNSPFDLEPGVKTYEIPANGTVDKKILHTCFRFDCVLAGAEPEPENAGLGVATL